MLATSQFISIPSVHNVHYEESQCKVGRYDCVQNLVRELQSSSVNTRADSHCCGRVVLLGYRCFDA